MFKFCKHKYNVVKEFPLCDIIEYTKGIGFILVYKNVEN